ncbi:MAG: hypothetical protein ABIK77_00125 [candidate division WOR-3 bacterium]|uniref:Uncharacterized protein n=1 Tax=candidate division WOR-3 bacterium TaxID=2052148 RepID=A0A7C4S186_UNCW3
MKKSVIILLGISAFLISCKKKEEKKELIPLSPGNYWIYRVWQIENGDTSLVDSFKMEVIGENNDTFCLTGSLFALEELAEDETVKIVVKDSLYLSYTDDEPDTQFVLPLKAGNSWQVNEEFTAEVLDIEDLRIGIENYSNCWRIRYQNEDGDIQKHIWVKEEIGIVKFQREEDGEITILELKEYNLKK